MMPPHSSGANHRLPVSQMNQVRAINAIICRRSWRRTVGPRKPSAVQPDTGRRNPTMFTPSRSDQPRNKNGSGKGRRHRCPAAGERYAAFGSGSFAACARLFERPATTGRWTELCGMPFMKFPANLRLYEALRAHVAASGGPEAAARVDDEFQQQQDTDLVTRVHLMSPPDDVVLRSQQKRRVGHMARSPKPAAPPVRFTSNIVGPILLAGRSALPCAQHSARARRLRSSGRRAGILFGPHLRADSPGGELSSHAVVQARLSPDACRSDA